MLQEAIEGVDGRVSVLVPPCGRLFRILRFALKNGKIAEVELIGDPERLKQIDLAALED